MIPHFEALKKFLKWKWPSFSRAPLRSIDLRSKRSEKLCASKSESYFYRNVVMKCWLSLNFVFIGLVSLLKRSFRLNTFSTVQCEGRVLVHIQNTLHKPVVSWHECFQYEERISSSSEVLMNGTVSNKNYDSKLNVVKQQWGGGGQWPGRREKQIRGRVMTLSSYTALLGTRLLFWTHYWKGFYRIYIS